MDAAASGEVCSPDENAHSGRQSRVVLAAATVASIPAGPCWQGNGDKKRRSPGRARTKP